MPLAQQIAEQLPFLRRYARALTGSQSDGDGFVRAVLEAALADEGMQASLKGGRVPLYRAFNRIWSSACMDPAAARLPAEPREAAVHNRLGKITPLNRRALLLIMVEGFSSAEAGAILELDAGEVQSLVDGAIAEIDREAATNVLIIEDEPLIAMQLEDLVQTLGHSICGTAATRTQAQQVVTRGMPGLVLADIQLADGSSGLDAVDDILALGEVPVIFITAYPERLLTGNRPEPTYLVAKPFREDTVRAAISQALFFAPCPADA